jgi:hypothetical protein
MHGILSMRVYRSGILIEEYEEHNLIVNMARFQMARLIAGDTEGRHITHIAFGTSGTEPAAADTVITGQFAKPLSGFSFPENGKVQFDWELPVTENNGMAIREFGLLTADGALFARRARTNPINKESDISIEGHWIIIF